MLDLCTLTLRCAHQLNFHTVSWIALFYYLAVDDTQLEVMNVDQCLASLNQRKDKYAANPTCVSSVSSELLIMCIYAFFMYS